MEEKTNPNTGLKKIDALKNILKAPSVEEQFRNALQENSGTFVASVIDLFNSDKSLQDCEPKQLVMEALKAAVLKLPINKALGFAWIVPYKSKSGVIATFQIGYKGYIQLAMRTAKYRIINADVVYEGELRQVNKLTGEIDFSGTKSSDKVEGYFAHIELLNGFAKTLYMTRDGIIAHAKKYSKSYEHNASAWQTDFDAMAKKTVIRNLLSHYGYLSVEMMGAIEGDISSDTDLRDKDVKKTTGSKEFVSDVEYEDVSDNGGKPEEVDPGF
ncbi:MAG: recombinase RecT [Bacteroidales bacterium]|nr:recombinase RecT [Bacteroidales bacterium]